MKANEYYVFFGKDAGDLEMSPMGPFPSISRAESELRKSSAKDFMDQGEIDLDDYENYFEVATIVKIEKVLQPQIKLTPKITLKNLSKK